MNTFEKNFDVVVCGAGVAGIAAAVKCARNGAKTCLVEKSVTPGGLATAGLVNIYLPLCDGNGNQLLTGITEELLKLSVKYGPESLPPGWGKEPGEKIGRYMTPFSPASFILALDELLEANGVDVWYDTMVIDSHLSAKRLDSIGVVNKSGQGILKAKAFIDATGDADLANFAGCELRDGLNHMSIWAIQASMAKADAAVNFNDPSMLLDVIRMGADDKGEGHPKGEKTWNGINGKNVSEFVMSSRRLLRTRYANLAENATDSSSPLGEFPLTLPTTPQFRKTRMITGEDSVFEPTASLPKSDTVNPVPDWRKAGRIWAIPDGAMRPIGIDGLFAAGRIISSGSDDAWDATRVIPVAAFTGERAAILAMND